MTADDLRAVAREMREHKSLFCAVQVPDLPAAVADWLSETARQMDFRKDGAVVDLRFITRAEAVVKAWWGES